MSEVNGTSGVPVGLPTPVGVADAIEPGRTELPWSQVHDWVMLSNVSPHAKALYGVYKMHINRSRGDNTVWPGMIALAAMLGLAKPDRITKLNRELVQLGAIEIHRKGMPRRNVYVIHSTPPVGYQGATTLKEWYRRNEKMLSERRDAALSKPSKAQNRRSASVTPIEGVQRTPESGVQRTPVLGVEPEESNHEENEPDETSAVARKRNSPASALTRQGTKKHRKITEAEDDAEAIRLAVADCLLEAEAILLVEYMRKALNATSTAAFVQHLINDGGLESKYQEALAWKADLDDACDEWRETLTGKGQLPDATADDVTTSMREAVEIGCDETAVKTAVETTWKATKDRTPGPYIAAVAALVKARKQERIGERRQRSAGAAKRKMAA